MSKSFNQHSKFFSSIKQVEKRLKLEENSSHSSPTEEIHSISEESLSSPIYLHNSNELHNHSIANQCSNHEVSEIPLEFLSNSLDFTPTQQEKSLLEETPLLLNPPKTLEDEFNCDADNAAADDDVDEIGSLIELLGLSDSKGNESNLELESCSSCHCDSGFLGKIVGVKGPKCKKEMERLEGWICHFRNENIEPLRLAHLLLGKAAVLYGNGDGDGGEGFEGLEFPSTVEEFLRRDPLVMDYWACE